VKVPCCSFGAGVVTVTFYFDDATLQVLECERTGEDPVKVRATARMDDGSAEWYADFSAPGDASVEGISFLSEERDGVTFTFTQVQD